MENVLKCGKCAGVLVAEAGETVQELEERAHSEERWKKSGEYGRLCRDCVEKQVDRTLNQL